MKRAPLPGELPSGAGALTATSALTDAHTGLSRACDVAPPQRITHLGSA